MTFLWGHLGLMWLPRHSGITRHCPAGAISANISCWHRDFPLWGLGLGISWRWIANQRALPSMANSRTQAVVVWNICVSCMLHMAMQNPKLQKVNKMRGVTSCSCRTGVLSPQRDRSSVPSRTAMATCAMKSTTHRAHRRPRRTQSWSSWSWKSQNPQRW